MNTSRVAQASPALPTPAPTVNDGWDATVELPPRWDSWSGTSATPDNVFSSGGLTYSLNGDKTRDGWRLRLESGTGTYGYVSSLTDGTNRFDVAFAGQVTVGNVLLGYQWQDGPWTTKVFAGFAYEKHRVGPLDPDNPVVGARRGAKVAVEGWRNVGDASFASFDLAFASPFSSYSANARYGQSIVEDLWLGIEAGGYGNAALNAARLGAFGRWRTDYGTLWVSGGVGGDYEDVSTPYGSVTLVRSF